MVFGKLDENEFEWIRKHPEYGWMALRNVEGFEQESLMVLHHHERMDGGGYPGGLIGSEIPLGSRIIAVADSMLLPRIGRTVRPAPMWKQSRRSFAAPVLSSISLWLPRSAIA